MTRINTNLPSIMGALYMNRNMKALNVALERMATGIRINSAKDDPDGIIVTDVLRGELTGIQSAINNAERANNLMATAEGAAASVAELLLDIKAVVHEAASQGDLTEAEIQSKQNQIDNDIQAIDKIIASATFAGQNLLDGSLGYQTSGVDGAVITDLAINKAPVGAASGEIPVAAELLVQAERGSLIFPNAAIAGDVSVSFSGLEGSQKLDFNTGTSSTELALAINSTTENTGLMAELVNGDPLQGVRIMTADYGSAATVRVEVMAGNPADFALQDELGAPAEADTGVDIELNINGSTVVGRGLQCHYASASLDMEMFIDEAWNAAGPPASTNFEIVSGGALFQIGPQIGAQQQDSIGIRPLDSTHLGRSALGYLGDLTSGAALSLQSGEMTSMIAVVDEGIQQVADIRARIGAFQNNTLGMTVDSLQQAYENISLARSSILDADYAEETAAMVRQQILTEATQAAMTMAHRVPQQVLGLLID